MVTLFDNETILKGYMREKVNAARAEALADGERRNAIETAKNLLIEGLPVELIARAVNLSICEIDAIEAKMES